MLDTHIWVRWVDTQAQPLPVGLLDKIETAEALAVSAVTCWEVAWLHRRGRLGLKLPLDVWIDNALQGSGVLCLPIDRGIALCAAALPEHHRDPADRLIIATALENNASLASLDRCFANYHELSGRLIQE